MLPWLSDSQLARYRAFKEFVSLNVTPFAEAWDRDEALPRTVLAQLGDAGYLGTTMPPNRRARLGHGHLRPAERGDGARLVLLTGVLTCRRWSRWRC